MRTSNNLIFRICCENIVNITLFTKKRKKKKKQYTKNFTVVKLANFYKFSSRFTTNFYWPLRGRRRGFASRVSVSSLIIYRVLFLCLHLSSLNLCHFIFVVDVILFGWDFLSILLYAYVHIPHINCLIISLNW